MRSVDDTIASLQSMPSLELKAPAHAFAERSRKLVLGVHSMQDHMTDEGWQITHGLSLNGYLHCGHKLPVNTVSVPKLVNDHQPGTIVIQDIREWEVDRRDFRDQRAGFQGIHVLRNMPEVFRLTILKDSHQRPDYHRMCSERMGIHAWVVYYNPRIVKHLAKYVRSRHLIRTTHSIDPLVVPDFSDTRAFDTLFSGAISGAYPLRKRMLESRDKLAMHVHPHPGYHRKGSVVPEFLRMLNTFKVAICTSSMYGYALRKLIESTACGCRIITDLPTDEILPVIEENLVRVPTDISIEELNHTILQEVSQWDAEKQKQLAIRAIEYYDYRAVTSRLAVDIEHMRQNYES